MHGRAGTLVHHQTYSTTYTDKNIEKNINQHIKQLDINSAVDVF